MKVFDEIDHGVSGLVAYKIAEKMKAIAKTSQVLCITHLPQVASIGDQHLKIKKQIIDSRTITMIEELNDSSRVNEIASMISKGEPTPASINLARELLGSHSE
jgi:DNA repair protein RecN (Recombination protein N)